MSTGYQIYNQNGYYFLTFQVIDWVDIFSRKIYRDIVINSLDYCRKNKGLQIWAYVIMSNHVHAILSAKNNNLSEIIRDFKRFTSTQILKEIGQATESRSDWMYKRFEFAAKSNKRSSQYQFWTHENHAVELDSMEILEQKMAYIHLNPVRSGWVEDACDWLYSSQRNYLQLESLIEIDLMDID
jgi:REP element-mobilizing transposase RayT